MYWFRSGSAMDIALYFMLSLGWSVGGWLVVRHAFRLRPSERLLGGLTTGLLLFIALSNLFANLLPLTLAFWLASALILTFGLALAARASLLSGPARLPRLFLRDLRAWPQLILLAAFTLLFVLIGRGLALFDDYLHLPLVSVMAAGDIPPHFYLNPATHFAYHYGLHVLAASMVRLGGFLPWSAWDLSKALAIALTLMLGWLWVRRITRSQRAAVLGSFLITFAGGARWLLLLVPLPILVHISQGIQMTNTGVDAGPDLLTALSHPWLAEGSGPYAFPFAFHSGIFIPAIFALSASGALPFASVILLLLFAHRRRFSIPAIIVLGLVFASLALSAEHLFVFLWAGIGLAGLVFLLRARALHKSTHRELVFQWAAILLLSGILSLVQGAFITEAARNVILGLQGIQSTTGGSYNYFSFTPRWPPAMISAHLGELSLFDPRQLVVLLAELGPGLLLAPFAMVYARRRLLRGDWISAGLGIAALLSLLVATFFQYGVERSSTRLPATALWIWVLLGFPVAWWVFRESGPLTRFFFRFGYGLAVFGGIVIFAVQLTALPAPQISYYISGYDAALSREYWNRLPEEAEIIDRLPERSVALFGRASRSMVDFYHALPDWEALTLNPEPVAIARAGYSFIYVDDDWWDHLRPRQQKALRQPCVSPAAELDFGGGVFRWLLDVRNCR